MDYRERNAITYDEVRFLDPPSCGVLPMRVDLKAPDFCKEELSYASICMDSSRFNSIGELFVCCARINGRHELSHRFE